MNLIEQFGYEAVKSELKNKKWRRDNLHGSAEFTWHMEQHIQLLEAILLQYRRQHNIFEVGDYVCFKTLGDGYVHKYTKYHEFKYDLKHATDEEIKAGKRL